ncbi:hypothetical protein [Rhizobium sp. SG741]|uniref:hypothetical protein n=1 Tax=Rhizobium sp. SG741 TaxID=2587114 RepID=UPI0017C689A8|nr:hypothetical protein [Rhizobium sp. SG741]NKJ03155.1 hypothetical protein [Rhizobium sp. SG741]
MKVVGFFIMVAGSGWGIWWKIDAKVEKVKTETTVLREDLAEHKLHTAEKYITKEGLRETTEQIMGAIGGVKTAIDNMTLRVDRVVENQNKPQRAARSS